MERCSPVYHHDNDADGDITIAEMYGGGGRVGSKCGIFFDNDQVYIDNDCSSPASTTVIFPSSIVGSREYTACRGLRLQLIILSTIYHDNNGDNGRAIGYAFGGSLLSSECEYLSITML